MAEVRLDNVTKTFPGAVTAVKGVSLTVSDGEFLVLVGPSGCGKSTLLRMIAGLEEVTGGTVSIGGRAVNDVPPRDRDIAMVFQDYALYPHMTVAENLSFGLRMHGLPHAEIDSRVAEAAAMLGLGEVLGRLPRALSGGQRQRVAVGRAIVRKPAAFLFDEPLSNLDAKLRAGMRAELKKLHARLGVTTIYVTHDQVEAMTMGERIAVMRDGLVQQLGAPLELYERPANRFVAGFLGTPPMNFLAGSVAAAGGRPAWTDGGLRLDIPSPAAEKLAGREGEPIELGVRPEKLELSAQPAAGRGVSIESRVEVVEPLGGQTIVHLSAGRHQLVATVDAHRAIKPGDVLHISAPQECWHVFDGRTGEALGV